MYFSPSEDIVLPKDLVLSEHILFPPALAETTSSAMRSPGTSCRVDTPFLDEGLSLHESSTSQSTFGMMRNDSIPELADTTAHTVDVNEAYYRSVSNEPHDELYSTISTGSNLRYGIHELD